jgi:hypothetical protein
MHTGLLVCQIAMQCTYALTAAMQCGTKVTTGTPAGIQESQKACVLLSCCNPPNKGTEEGQRRDRGAGPSHAAHAAHATCNCERQVVTSFCPGIAQVVLGLRSPLGALLHGAAPGDKQHSKQQRPR